MTKWKEMLHKEQKYLQELLNQLEKQEKRNLAGRLRISSDRDIQDIITARVAISGVSIFLKRIWNSPGSLLKKSMMKKCKSISQSV